MMMMMSLVISILALSLSILVGLAMMELIASGGLSGSLADERSIVDLDLSPEIASSLATSHGLSSSIENEIAHLVLFVSPRCRTCDDLVRTFSGLVPEGLTLVVTASDLLRQRSWISAAGLSPIDVVLDEEQSIALSLDISGSPTVVGFADGKVVFKKGISMLQP